MSISHLSEVRGMIEGAVERPPWFYPNDYFKELSALEHMLALA